MLLRQIFNAEHLCYTTLNIFEMIKIGNKRTSINKLCPLFTSQGRETIERKRAYYTHSLFALCVHSFRSPSSQISVASSKANFPQRVIQCFLFHFPISYRFLKVIQQLLMSPFQPSRLFYVSLYVSFNNVVQKTVPAPSFQCM